MRQLSGKSAVVAASGDDPFPLTDLRDDVDVRGWTDDRAVAWLAEDSWTPNGDVALSAIGPPDAVGRLLTEMATAEGLAYDRLRVTRGAMPLLPDSLRPARWVDWDWWWTSTPPAEQPGEDGVRMLGEDDHDDVAALLEVASPSASASVDDASVLRWCGIRDETGALVACAADARYVPGWPHLASIATHPDLRGRGLGGAVTSWLTRRCFEDGAPIVALGMYASNPTARQVYRRLGFVDRHHWSGARLHLRRA